jgi:hypothetical protein
VQRLPWHRITLMLAVALLLFPAAASAEWQLKPFLGITFGGATTFVDAEDAAGEPNIAYGASVLLIGEIIGIDADVSFGPGYFDRGDLTLVSHSRVTTVTGNVVLAMPRRLTEYTLRPYFVGGAGMLRVNVHEASDAFVFADNLVGIDVGGGVTGFLGNTRRFGVNWEVRHFSSIGGNPSLIQGVSFGPEQISFWRASMALVFR